MDTTAVQVLDPDGRLVGALPQLGDGELVELYRHMLRVRDFDRRAVAAQRQGRIGAYPMLEGQEAAQVGSAYALEAEDYVYPSYREHGVHLTRGLPMSALLEVMCGLPAATWDVHRFRTMPMTIPIASQLPHAVGHAYAAMLDGDPLVTIGYFGDGASSATDFHAGLNFAAVWQTPTVFFCQNNLYAISVPFAAQTATATVAEKAAAYGLPGVLVDGMDVLAVYEVTRKALARARHGGGPTLIEAQCYRFGAHTTADDARTYRSAEEEAAWRARDPLLRLRAFLEAEGRWNDADEATVLAMVADEFEAALGSLGTAVAKQRSEVVRHVYHRVPPALSRQLHDLETLSGHPLTVPDSPEATAATPSVDVADAVTGATATRTRSMTMAEAINAALHEAMERDPSTILLGEDVGLAGGVFRVTEGLQAKYGTSRVIDTPLNEAGIVGTAIGMAVAGKRPIAEIQFDAFVYPAFEQLVNHVGRMRSRTRGQVNLPLVVRWANGAGISAPELHTDSPEAFFAHAPGHTVVMPSSPREAKGLLVAAIAAEDPVLFLEPKYLYRRRREEVPLDHYIIPLGRAHVVRAGSDMTLVTYGTMLPAAMGAAEETAADGVEVEVIDLRTLYPWDEDAVAESVERTGRLLAVQETWRTCGIAAEVCAQIAQRCGYSLLAPVRRVTAPDVPWPPYALQSHVFLTATQIAGAIRQLMQG